MTQDEEILRLRSQLAQLQREQDTDARKRKGSVALVGRWTAAVVLVLLTAVLAVVAVPAMYLRAELLDTDRYVATVAPLAEDPAVQREIADKVTAQVTGAVDIEGITRDALAELAQTAPRVAPVITGLAPAIAEQFTSLVRTAVSNYVASPQFQDLWIQVNRAAHQGVVNLATGKTDGIVTIDDTGAVTISTKEIVARVKDRLIQQGVGIAARIPDIDASIALFQSPELARAGQAINILDRTAPMLVGLSIVSALGAIAVTPRGGRRRTTTSVGWAIAAAMALLALALAIGRSIYLTMLPPEALSRAAAQSLFDTLLSPMRTSLRLVLVVGLLVAVAAILGGPSRTATQLRRGVALAGNFVAGKVNPGNAKPWQRSLARNRRIAEGAVLGAAVLLLIFWQEPTATVVIWTSVVAVLLILLIELACWPAITPPAAEPGVRARLDIQGQGSQ